jgi:PAS domain S-box-containing protein
MVQVAACALHADGAAISITTGDHDPIVAAGGQLAALLQGENPTPTLHFNGLDANAFDRPLAMTDAGREAFSAIAGDVLKADVASLMIAPIQAEGNGRIGTITVATVRKRRWSVAQMRTLNELAQAAADTLEYVRAAAIRQAELDHSSSLLRRSFEDAPAGQAVSDPAGRILDCNAEFAKITGYDSVDLALASSLTQLESEPGAFAELLEQLRQDPQHALLQEMQLAPRNGTRIRVIAKLSASVTEAAEISEIRIYLIDITQRFLAEETLRQSHERLELIELATSDVLWEWDLTTGRLNWNGAVARRFRYTPDEVRPTIEWHEERLHPEDRERVIRGLERAILGVDSSWADEYRFLCGDGTYATVLDRAHVVRNNRTEPLRVIGWMLDITERKETEEFQRFLARISGALEASLEVEATARNFASLCVPGIADACTVDLLQPDGTLQRVAVSHARRELEQALNPGTIIAPHDEVGAAPFTVAASNIPIFEGDGRPSPEEDGQKSARLAIGETSGIRSYVIVPIEARDHVLGATILGVTDSRRRFGPFELLVAKEVVRRLATALDNAMLYDTARRAVLARDEVLGLVSHDLRSPLSTIVAVTNLLSDNMEDRRGDLRHWVETLTRSADQMRMLIDDLLDVSRIEANRFAVDLAPESPRDILSQACEMLQPLAEKRDLRLECVIEEDIPPVVADGRQVIRVLTNLVNNAINFSLPGGLIRIVAKVMQQELWISVQDTGTGITEDELPRVFDRFWRGRVGDRRGAGLGLAIAKGVIDAHGGRIWVESKRGVGSTFTFTLPLAQQTSRRALPVPLHTT